jgi:hypothetical protein
MIARDPEILAEERLWERWSAVRRTGQDNEPRRPMITVVRTTASAVISARRIASPARERKAEPA